MDTYLILILIPCLLLIVTISVYRLYISPKSIKRTISLDNLRLAKTKRGNIIMVFAYDFKEKKAVVGKFDMKSLTLNLGTLPINSLYIYSLSQMESLTTEENDSKGDIRGGLGYLMNTGIPFQKDWGLFDWSKVSYSNNSFDRENTGKNMIDVVVSKPIPFSSSSSPTSTLQSQVYTNNKKSQ